MNRGKRAFLITVGIAGALLGVTYFLFRPTWKTATEAEVRAAIDPALLVVDETDPEAQARLKKVEESIKAIQAAEVANKPSQATIQAFYRREERRLQELDALVAQGPLQRKVSPSSALDFPDFSRRRPLYRAIAVVSRSEIAAGRKENGLRLLHTGIALSNRLRETEDSIISSLVGTAMDAILHAAIRETLSSLDERELKALADAVPRSSSLVGSLNRAIRSEFQTYLLPMLPDPLAWSLREEPREDPHRSLAKLFADGDGNVPEAIGNYEAIQTARDVSLIAGTTLKNAGRQRTDWDLRGEKYAEELMASLPDDHSAGTSGAERTFKGWVYRWQLTRVPNSAGRRLMGMLLVPTLPSSNLSRRASLESIQTLIALRRYQVRKGGTAATLDALVREGLLPALPPDPFARGSLRYDPERKLLWSVGINGKDDGGTAFRMATPAEPDTVWPTP